ncbi:MAG: hypothetical protein ACR2M3_10795 [Thermomicrobiales bacterium]
MAEATFLIPEKDAGRAHALEQHLCDVVGLKQMRIVHKPFDPFGPDADAQPSEEACVTVAYDPAETTIERIRKTFTALGIHVLDARADG